jgi:small subunit ribosomal protein S18
MVQRRRNDKPENRQGKPGSAAPGGSRRPYFRRRKVCKFCDQKIDVVDYKEVRLLSQFISERGKILPRRLTGTCSPHQRLVAVAVKRARNIALLPFATRL